MEKIRWFAEVLEENLDEILGFLNRNKIKEFHLGSMHGGESIVVFYRAEKKVKDKHLIKKRDEEVKGSLEMERSFAFGR